MARHDGDGGVGWEPGAAALVLAIGNDEPTPEQSAHLRALSTAGAVDCRDNPDAGLP